MTFILALLVWMTIGVLFLSLLYFVYFRGFNDAFENMKTFEDTKEEAIHSENIWNETPGVFLIGFFITGCILGPIAILSLVMNFYRYSIKKRN